MNQIMSSDRTVSIGGRIIAEFEDDALPRERVQPPPSSRLKDVGTTVWLDLVDAASSDEETRKRGIQRLLGLYFEPSVSYLKSRPFCLDEDDARNVATMFFQNRIGQTRSWLAGRIAKQPQRSKGYFRASLKLGLRQTLWDWREQDSRRRDKITTAFQGDEKDPFQEPIDPQAGDAFDRLADVKEFYDAFDYASQFAPDSAPIWRARKVDGISFAELEEQLGVSQATLRRRVDEFTEFFEEILRQRFGCDPAPENTLGEPQLDCDPDC